MGIYRENDPGHIDVRDFGAIGDGATDDTVAIVAAWAAVLAGGRKLFFPAGTYKISSNLVFSVTGSSPAGRFIEGIPGASIIKPTAAVSIAITLATESNTDGYCNALKISGLRLDGVSTSGATGILVGENAGDLSSGIVIEDIQVLRFDGANSKGIDVRNVVNARFTRVYVGRCGTNLYIKGDDVGNALPTTVLFNNCQFREANDGSGGTGRGIDIVQGYRISFAQCLSESNDKEGLYCAPSSGTNNVLWLAFDDAWFEGNQANGASTDYQILADGSSAGTVMLGLRNVNFNGSPRSIYLKTVVNSYLDNVYPRATANSVVIDTGCRGTIFSWPENNVSYATAVTNSSAADFGFLSYVPGLFYNGITVQGLAALSGTTTLANVTAAAFTGAPTFADALIGAAAPNLDLVMQPGNDSDGIVAIRDYTGTNIFAANQNRLAMDKRLVYAGDTVSAANDLTLPVTGNFFVVTGTTQINAITTANWGSGIVILLFSSTPTVKHNTSGGAGTAPIQLDGAADLVAANGTTLVLCYDGANWQEIGRKTAAGGGSGILAVANGGTGSSTASGARSNLGAAQSTGIGAGNVTVSGTTFTWNADGCLTSVV